jgi:CO dehydrogenase/acetyl-CoA synthase beta subunit
VRGLTAPCRSNIFRVIRHRTKEDATAKVVCVLPPLKRARAYTIAQKFIDKFIDSVGTHAFRDVEDLKDLLKRLESEIKENYKPSDEIQEWQSELDLASIAVEVYCQGWQVCVCVPDFQSVCVCVCHSVWTCIAKDVRPWPKSTQL